MKLPHLMALAAPVIVSMTLSSAIPAFAQSKFDEQFVSYPTYSGDDLELLVDNSGTHFRLWARKPKRHA